MLGRCFLLHCGWCGLRAGSSENTLTERAQAYGDSVARYVQALVQNDLEIPQAAPAGEADIAAK